MRCSAWSSLAISVCSALALAGPAATHVGVQPPFVAAGDTQTLSLTVPNERAVPMTGLTVTASSGARIVEAHPVGWHEAVGGGATWSGGSFAPGAQATFTLDVEAPDAPGAVELRIEQEYGDGETVSWTVPLTITPADEASQNLIWAAVAGVAGLLVIAATAVVAWRRRTGSLQEK